MDAYDKIRKAVTDISDNRRCDSGSGLGSYDLWAMIDGVEYYINIKPSNANKKTAQ